MNSIFKYFAILLISIFACTGCNGIDATFIHNNQPKDDVPLTGTETYKYKSGTILLKDNNIFDDSNKQKFHDPEPDTQNIHFGPKEIHFGS